MRDSAGHHADVIEVLTEFIRDRAPRRARQSGRQGWVHPVTGSVPDLPHEPTPDIQAALTALGHRPYRPERQTIGLTGLHLAYAQLADASLTGADLSGARLDHANLTRAWLDGANLSGAQLLFADLTRTHLSSANLIGAWLDRANLTGAWLDGASLTGAWLDGARLTRANLSGADLTDAHLLFVDLTGANLGGADLIGAGLGDAIWPLDAAAPKGWRRDNSGRLRQFPIPAQIRPPTAG